MTGLTKSEVVSFRYSDLKVVVTTNNCRTVVLKPM
jgi:hypothetical protein